MPPLHIANWIKDKLPTEKKEATWDDLTQDFPWYPMLHWLKAAENPTQQAALEKAGLYANDTLRLHGWLQAYKQPDLYPHIEVLEHSSSPIYFPPNILEESIEPVPAVLPINLEEAVNPFTPEIEEVVAPIPEGIGIENNQESNQPGFQPETIDLAEEQFLPDTIQESFQEDDIESLPPELEEKNIDAFIDHLHEEALQGNEAATVEIQPENIDSPSEPLSQGLNQDRETEADKQQRGEITVDQEVIGEQAEDYPEEEETTPASEIPELPIMNLSGLSKIMETPVSENELLTPMEPYHTVDYFASQGIKVEKNLKPETATQLDKQVKSFTEWLKSMKKLSYQPATAYTDPLVEKKAKTSLQKEEVVTEAMAEVWVKQAHWEEAIKVYNKLMLLHPEKSHYFAARIKDLKEKQ